MNTFNMSHEVKNTLFQQTSVGHSLEGWKKYNMNETVLVKPNELGKEAFIKEWMLVMSREEAEKYFESKLNKDGYMELQLWCAFEYFSTSICAGHSGLNTSEFYIKTNSKEKVFKMMLRTMFAICSAGILFLTSI